MTDPAAPSTAQDTIEIARRKLQTLALNPLVDEAFKQYEETVATLQRELTEARADIADLLPRMDADAITISNMARELEAVRAHVNALADDRNEAFEQLLAKRRECDRHLDRLADAERRLGAAVQVRHEAISRLTVLVEAFPGECRFDHHGFCQEHLVTNPCEIEQGRRFLSAALDALAQGEPR